ncbi:LytTR family DNA-binding domain-containing protein [Erythrobacter alti]|uniref:LytTR family DNA-binding domain-containing protein n=1 Tax=Erythrobacter alti TaxID=1896145 RepID=UPI0030F370DE
MSNPAQPRRNEKLRQLLIDLAIMTGIGVVLALIGPFGSFADPIGVRLVVWLGFAYIGYAVYSPIDGLARRLAPQLDLPEWGLQVAGCMIASVPMAVAVYLLPRIPGPIVLPNLTWAVTHYFYVLMVGGIITLLFAILPRSRAVQLQAAPVARNATGTAPSGSASASFLDRLPPELGSDLLALEMEDHYVRAHTALGSDLVLMRMRDAVAEVGDLEGAQVHRSWWVARGAVADVKREGRNVRLVLENGLEAPVSRANVTPLKDAGWF